MTASQINWIFSQNGGKDKVLGEKLYVIHLNNNRQFAIDPQLSKEVRLDRVQFDDSKELLVVKENSRIMHEFNNFTPVDTVQYIPYEYLEGIVIVEGISKITTIPENVQTNNEENNG